MMKKPLIQLVIAQLKVFIREPGALFWSFIFPLITAWGLGTAFSDKKNVEYNVAVVYQDTLLADFIKTQCTPATETYVEHSFFTKTIEDKTLGYITWRFMPTTLDSAILLTKRGHVSMILNDSAGKIYYQFDIVNPEARLIHTQLPAVLNGEITNTDHPEIKAITLTGSRYIDFLIPGLLTMGIMMSCMWGVSYTLIEKRSKKLLKRMVLTPMKKYDFLFAQMITRIIITSIEALAILIFAYFVFNLQIQGSIVAFIILFLSGNFAFIGIAILTASHTANTQVANGLINAVVMPMMFLSGIFFNYHHFPTWAVNILEFLPLTVLTDAIRNVFNEGANLLQVLNSIVILIIIGISTFIAGLKIYKWY